MKLVVHKVYCPRCARLVKGRLQEGNGELRLACPRCNLVIWQHVGQVWRYAVKE